MWKRMLVIFVLAAGLFFSFTPALDRPAAAPATEKQLRKALDAREVQYEAIAVRLGLATWDYYNGVSTAGLDTPHRQFAKLFADAGLGSAIGHWYPRRRELRDPELCRRVELWHNMMQAAAVEYDPAVYALRSRLEKLLAVDAPAGDSADPDSLMLELMILRNQKAKELGYATFAELVLQVSETGVEWFAGFAEALEQATREPYRRLLEQEKAAAGKEQLNFEDIVQLFAGAPDFEVRPEDGQARMTGLLLQTVSRLGFPSGTVPDMMEKELPAGIGGQGFGIRIPDDCRVVIAPRLGLAGRLHETGHVLQYRYTKVKSPVLKGYEWCTGSICPAFDEGMAEVMARFRQDPGWQQRIAGRTPAETEADRSAGNRYLPLILRFKLLQSMREIELYKNPGQDPTALRDALIRKYMMVEPPAGQPARRANLIFVTYPVYVQNYLLADLVSWHVHQGLRERFGPGYATSKGVAKFLARHVYPYGARHHWREILRMATGRELDVRAWLASLGM